MAIDVTIKAAPIDVDFILNKLEGTVKEGDKFIGHIPKEGSGITIAKGLDLGYQNKESLMKLGLNESLIENARISRPPKRTVLNIPPTIDVNSPPIPSIKKVINDSPRVCSASFWSFLLPVNVAITKANKEPINPKKVEKNSTTEV